MRNIFIFTIFFFAIFAFTAMQQNEKATKTSDLRLTQIAGKELFTLKKCDGCHTLADKAEGEKIPVASKRDDEWLSTHVDKETEIVLAEAKSARIKRRVLGNELEALSDFLFKSKPAEKQEIIALPENIRKGAYLAYQNNCLNCHQIVGFGKTVGPDLTHVADKHDRKWLLANLQNPQQFTSDSPMPALGGVVSESDLNLIVDYLLTLAK